MEFFNTLKKVSKIRFYVGLLLIGLLFTVIGVIVLLAPKAEMIETDATIDRIETIQQADGEEYVLYISYTDQAGVKHENIEYHGYSTGMKEGKTIRIEYDAANPESVSSTGSAYLPYVLLGVGVIAVAASLVLGIRAIKTSTEETNDLNKVDMTSVDARTIEDIRTSDEPTCEYYFHFCGKLNQSYIMETPQRTPVYQADCDKIGVFKPYEFTFINHQTGSRKSCKVTHTKTVRYGDESLGFSIPDSSCFKIDGENNWIYLGRLGYSLEIRIKGIKLNFDLYHYGVKVGTVEAAGANVLSDDKQYKLGDVLPATGVYKVHCRPSDAEGAFMACFSAARVEFF